MDRCLEKEERARKTLAALRIIYIVGVVFFAVRGCMADSLYETVQSIATLVIFPGVWLVRRLFRFSGGYQLECILYIFVFLSWLMGSAGELYYTVPYFDKMVHCLSGLFVSFLALTLYMMLERRHSRVGENPVTACLFVFFTSMAVAGMFELCEFVLTPITGRDMQHVAETGVTDTMGDMFVCLIGTIFSVIMMILAVQKQKPNFFTDVAQAFVYQNPVKEKKQGPSAILSKDAENSYLSADRNLR